MVRLYWHLASVFKRFVAINVIAKSGRSKGHNVGMIGLEPTPQIRLYQNWLAQARGLQFDDYDALWRWSVTDLDAFWQSVWDYFELQSPTPHSAVLGQRAMPGAQWFVGAQLNYAAQVLRHTDAAHACGLLAIVADNELGEVRELSWPELRQQVAAFALYLQGLGVQRGDRVAAVLPNGIEAIVAFLGTASIGAVWSVCAPDMGTPAVLDRFKQIEPKVLVAAEGVRYGGKSIDRRAAINALLAQLPSVNALVVVESAHANPQIAIKTIATKCLFTLATCQKDVKTDAFQPLDLPMDHPLWIVYSSGTTGAPKPIVHGHGGIVLTLLTLKALHNDIGCSYEQNTWGERFHWYSSTGWVMWNAQLGGLATGTTICLYDGNPAGSQLGADGKLKPDWGTLWRFAARHRVTWFGAGAAFYGQCMKSGLDLAALHQNGADCSRIRALGSTGSPLPEDVQRWGTAQFAALRGLTDSSQAHRQFDIWWCNVSGGTDFCGAFIGGNRELPQVPGQMQCRSLGCAVYAWDENGQAVTDAVGELVCTEPIPSMPLYFWNDPGHARYLGSYFDTYPGVWRHGDWLKVGTDGGCIIYGRSDATINRQGLRMGTSEIYSAVEALPEILDSMVVDLEFLGQDSFMPLFVVLRPGATLDEPLRQRIHDAIRVSLSPRFLPNAIEAVAEIPRTLSGKKQELPIKKLLLGQPIDKVVNPDAMANPGCLAWYVDYARSRLATHAWNKQ